MAAPTEMTSRDMSGRFTLNTALSSGHDKVLDPNMHGYTALLALEHVAPRLVIRHTPASSEDDSESLETIAVERTLGARTFAERRVLDGVEVARVGSLSARPLRVRACRATPAALACAWLRAEDAWLPESFVDGELVHTSSRCEPADVGVEEDKDSEGEEDGHDGDKPGERGLEERGEGEGSEGGCTAAWRIEQTWGFEEVGGEKRYVRRVYFVSAQGKVFEGRLVYDYEGGL